MPKPVINLDELEFVSRTEATRATGAAAEVFDARFAQVSSRVGAQRLGFNVTSVPAGKVAFPCHSHRANEEIFFVLEGTGVVRIGSETFAIRKGDFIACPPGGPETAHQIQNTGGEDLSYIAISTLVYPEIVDYPDSNKFGAFVRVPGAPPGSPGEFRYLGRQSTAVGYWDGEGNSGA